MSALLLSVWVPGIPRPKGSVTPNKGGKTVRPAQAQTTSWQKCVALFVRRELKAEHRPPGYGIEHIPPPMYGGPVQFSGAFLFARPKGDESAYPMGRAYDGDKLQRCAADALSACGSRGSSVCRAGCRKHGGLLADDDRIVRWGPFDVLWAADGQPGAQLEVRAK